MSIQKALLTELERETNNTLRILNNLNDSSFDFKPHQKSMSLGQLTNHIVELHNWVALALTQDTLDLQNYDKPKICTTVAELKEVLENGVLKNKELIEKLNEDDYFKTWTLKAGEHVIVSLPKAGVLRFLINNHLIHHRGQLTVYMRLLDIPVPGIYGPSADDN